MRLFSLFSLAFLLLTLPLRSYDRVILIEEFTNADCGPCVQGTKNLNTVVDPANGILSIRYHPGWPSRYDPLYTNAPDVNLTRTQYYGITGVPTAVLYGEPIFPGVATSTGLAKLKQKIDSLQHSPTPVKILVNEDRSDLSNVQVTVQVTTDSTLSSAMLRVAVVSRVVQIPGLSDTLKPGSNGEEEFYDAVLAMLPDAMGTAFSLDAGATKTFTFSYALPNHYLWDPTQIYIVAFVQDDATHTILQCGTNYQEIGVEITSNPTYQWATATDSPATGFFTVRNPADHPVTVMLRLSGFSKIPKTWSATMETEQITLGAQESATYAVRLDPQGYGGYAEPVVEALAIETGKVSKIAAAPLGGFLSTATRFVYWRGDSSVYFFQSRLSKFLQQWQPFASYGATIPRVTPSLVAAYPPPSFDLTILSDTRFARVLRNFYSTLSDYLDDGKSLWILSAGSLSILASIDTDFQQWLNDTIGISDLESQRWSNSSGYTPFTITGVTGDTLGDGITLSFNASGTLPKIPYTDAFLQLAPDVIPFLHYSNGSAAAIRRILPSGARIVCTGFTANISKSEEADFGTLTQRILQWLLPEHAPVSVEEKNNGHFHAVLVGNQHLRITLPQGGQHYRLILYDLRGRRLRAAAGVAAGETLWWNLHDLPSGTYYLEYVTNDRALSQLFTLLR